MGKAGLLFVSRISLGVWDVRMSFTISFYDIIRSPRFT